jgi:hypothetical protein
VVLMLFSVAGKDGGRQDTAVGKAAAQLVDEDGDTPLSRCFFDEPNDRLKVLAEADLVRWSLGGKGSQAAKARHLRQTQGCRARDSLEKSPACLVHLLALSEAQDKLLQVAKSIVREPRCYSKNEKALQDRQFFHHSMSTLLARFKCPQRETGTFRDADGESGCAPPAQPGQWRDAPHGAG